MSLERLGDRYELRSQIAVGGMGIVYRAEDLRLRRTVAIKILKDHLSHDDRFVERFRREARAVASLTHPNIAALYDYGEDGGRHFIVMECVNGRDLARVLREEGALQPERAARIAREACAALAAAHAAGIIHRDVKPANIMLADDDMVKVTDFGIARAAGDATLTATGSILGTAHYLAPEQAAGEPASPATDVYAMGVVLFEMLTGSPPFEGESPVVIATRHLNESVPTPSSVGAGIPTSLDAVVDRATHRSTARRYADGGEMGAALNEALLVGGGAPAGTMATEELRAPATQTAPLPNMADRIVEMKPPTVPARIGGIRTPTVVLVGLAAIALALLAFRLVEDPRPTPARAERPADTSEPPPEEEPTEEVTVPEVENVEVGVAKEALNRAGLAWQIEGDSEGIVVGASPAPGSVVEKGATVTLAVVAPPLESEDDEEGSDEGPPGHSKGRGEDKKDKDKDKEEDD